MSEGSNPDAIAPKIEARTQKSVCNPTKTRCLTSCPRSEAARSGFELNISPKQRSIAIINVAVRPIHTDILGDQSLGLDTLSRREQKLPGCFASIQRIFWIFVVMLDDQDFNAVFASLTAALGLVM
jgi:hypothetical protein